MKKIKIDKRIPTPPVRRKGQSKYGFHLMKNGDSVYIKGYKEFRCAVSVSALFGKRNGCRFVSSGNPKEKGGRIWRTK